MDCSPPGPHVHGILPARILEWVTVSSSKGSSWPRDQTHPSCITGRFFTHWAIREGLAIENTVHYKTLQLLTSCICRTYKLPQCLPQAAGGQVGTTESMLTPYCSKVIAQARQWSSFTLLHGAVQFSQHHLLKSLSYPHCIFLVPLSSTWNCSSTDAMMGSFTREASSVCWEHLLAFPDAAEGFGWPWWVSLSRVRSQWFKASCVACLFPKPVLPSWQVQDASPEDRWKPAWGQGRPAQPAHLTQRQDGDCL